MGKALEQYAMNTAEQIQGGILGLIAGKYNDKRQLKQQQKLQNMQIAGMQQMSEFEQQQQLEIWEKTGFQGQMEQLKKAGLNPALMYGMGGGGGATVGHGSGTPTGATAPTGGGEFGMGIQAAMMKAQLRLMEAQAHKTNVEADTIAGVDTTKTLTEIEHIKSQIKTEQGRQMLDRIQAAINTIELDYQQATLEERIQTTTGIMSRVLAEATEAQAKEFITQATKDTIVKTAQTQLANTILQGEAQRAGITLTKEQTAKISQEIAQIAHSMGIAERHATVEEINADTNKKAQEHHEKIDNVKESTRLATEKIVNIISALRGGGVSHATKGHK